MNWWLQSGFLSYFSKLVVSTKVIYQWKSEHNKSLNNTMQSMSKAIVVSYVHVFAKLGYHWNVGWRSTESNHFDQCNVKVGWSRGQWLVVECITAIRLAARQIFINVQSNCTTRTDRDEFIRGRHEQLLGMFQWGSIALLAHPVVLDGFGRYGKKECFTVAKVLTRLDMMLVTCWPSGRTISTKDLTKHNRLVRERYLHCLTSLSSVLITKIVGSLSPQRE